MKKKYILWDHDGVLVNTEPWYFKANEQALLDDGISISENEYMRFMQSGESVWTLAEERGMSDASISEGRARRDRYYQDYIATEDIEIPGVIEVLEKLKSRFSMAVVTTSRREDFELIRHNRSITDYMDFCLTSGDYAHAKPCPDPYLTAVKRFGAEPGECIAVEDSARGLKAAIAAGIDCVIIRHDFTKSHDFTGAWLIQFGRFLIYWIHSVSKIFTPSLRITDFTILPGLLCQKNRIFYYNLSEFMLRVSNE